MTKLELYEKSLKMIAHFEGHIGDQPMQWQDKLMWAQEFAIEALQGIDPTTGKKVEELEA